MRDGLRFAATAVLLVAFAVGCTCMQKSWGKGALAGAGVGAIGGGIAAGAAANNTGAFDIGDDNEDKALAIGTGAVSGALVGALIGHCLWDREVVAPAPPPPPPAPTPTPVPKKIVLRGVNFDFDKATLRADGKPVLDEAVRTLKDERDIKVSVEGHTDAIGSDAYNQRLSERRAGAVADYLAAGGIARARMATVGFGESKPVASNETEDGRAQNRRVEFRVSDK